MFEYAFSLSIQQALINNPALAYALHRSKFFDLVVDSRQSHTVVRGKLAALEHSHPGLKCFAVHVSAPGQPLCCYKFSSDSRTVDDEFLIHSVLSF